MRVKTSPAPEPKATKNLTVSAGLHGKLKGKAQREGRKLQPMVEEKLNELFAGEQMDFLEGAAK